MTVRCANCRQIYQPRPVVDLESDVVMWDGKAARLGPREAEVLSVLLDSRAPMSADDLDGKIFGLAEMSCGAMQIRRHIFTMRPKLERLSIAIKARRGFTYSVHFAPLPAPLKPRSFTGETT